ncbi:MAG: hypothetical protein EU541_00715 [Promethearchaeota archaeon]|nr:MAG: hypothetical protein EU541_00715 [Candidatus Lokiarchaeota archaeon]
MEKKEKTILDHFQGRLYEKEQIKRWNLPKSLQEDLGIKKFNYYFLTTSIEKEKHGHENHIHFCLFPTENDPVFLLEVETPKILPELLHKCLQIIKKKVNNILTSTGFCKTNELCYFGIFFSLLDSTEDQLNELNHLIGKIEPVRDVNIYKYTSSSKIAIKI